MASDFDFLNLADFILADLRMDCLRGYLATLSVLIVRIALLEYSEIHEKPYKFIVCEFGGF